jgi:NitT/TauT family transport system permease protein
MRTIVVPASLPYVFAGLRLGMSRAFIGIIVAEIETSGIGIGNLLNNDVNELRFDNMWVGIVTLGICSMLITAVIKAGERYATEPWRRKKRLRWL